jgi:hypothetical protein
MPYFLFEKKKRHYSGTESVFFACLESKRSLLDIFYFIHCIRFPKKTFFLIMRKMIYLSLIKKKTKKYTNFIKNQIPTKPGRSSYLLKTNNDTLRSDMIKINHRQKKLYDKINTYKKKKKNQKNYKSGFRDKSSEKKTSQNINLGKLVYFLIQKSYHKGCDFTDLQIFFHQCRVKNLLLKDIFSSYIIYSLLREDRIYQRSKKCAIHKMFTRFLLSNQQEKRLNRYSENPCITCPLANECHPQGLINPFDCVYMNW